MAKTTDHYPAQTTDCDTIEGDEEEASAEIIPEIPNSMKISHRMSTSEPRHQMPVPQTQRQHMENVYRAMMPLTGSTSRMGVTITAKPLPERKAERRLY